MTQSLTISNLSAKAFLKNFYDINIPLVNKISVYSDIKLAYYGGITEVSKPIGKELYYYDVHSLYPYVSKQDMPGLECLKVHYFYCNNIDIYNLFGFYYCDIISPNGLYLGLLPVRNQSGIYFPEGRWSGWYFSEELKFAKLNGYDIKVIKGYSFSRTKNVFARYVDNIYKFKANYTNSTQKSIAKSLLNNLLGKFGIRLDKSLTKIVSSKTFDLICVNNKISSFKQITSNKILVTYTPILDDEIIKSNDLDITKLVSKFRNEEEIHAVDVTSVPISAAVTSYARIYITKLKLDIMAKGGEIYYSDTD